MGLEVDRGANLPSHRTVRGRGDRAVRALAAATAALLAVAVGARAQDCATSSGALPVVHNPPEGVDACEQTWTQAQPPPVAPVDPRLTGSVGGTTQSACWLAAKRFLDGQCGDGAVGGGSTVVGGGGSGSTTQLPPTWPAVWDAFGFPLNFSLMAQPSIGDFLPPSPTVGGSSVSLLPPGASEDPTGWQGLGRPTQSGVVDLVTGLPLVQVQDLAIPFGGASFRLIRTRSASTGLSEAACAQDAQGRWWDWAGDGWMISENPLLLINSAIPDIVGNQPRTCYLILDAHHSIPFQLLENIGQYEAPARFRARLSHNGSGWNAATRTWAQYPTQFVVHLYDGLLKYTFNAVWEDVPIAAWNPTRAFGPCTPANPWPCQQPGQACPDICPSSLHDRPFLLQQFVAAGRSDITEWLPFDHIRQEWNADNPGIGMPYYAMLTKIEDTSGHRAEITYCPQQQWSVDSPATAGCMECGQNCPAKGQIKHIRLIARDSAGADVVKWTLWYVHRAAPYYGTIFGVPEQPEASLDWEALNAAKSVLYGRRTIDSIFAFEGDRTTELASACDAIPATAEYAPSSTLPTGATEAQRIASRLDCDHVTVPAALQDWKFRVRYHYRFQRRTQADGTQKYLLPEHPVLVKTSVVDRGLGGAPAGTVVQSRTTETVFAYKGLENGLDDTVLPGMWLSSVYRPDDLDRVAQIAENPRLIPGYTGPNASALRWVSNNHLALQVGSVEGYSFASSAGSATDAFLACASVRLDSSGAKILTLASLGLSPTGPSLDSLHELPAGRAYLRAHATGTLFGLERWALHQTPITQTRLASVRESDGLTHHYRVHRLVSQPGHTPTSSTVAQGEIPWPDLQRTTFHAPYSWRGYWTRLTGPDSGDVSLTEPPGDYTQARWISIIDEFVSASARDNPSGYYGGAYAIKPGQTARRVVEVSASGVVLRDYSWRFTGALDASNTLLETSGSGLGEEYLYKTGEQIFQESGMALPAPPPAGPVLTMAQIVNGERPPQDEFASIRRELMLVEHRSIGWSAADRDNAGGTLGLVRFYEYLAMRYDSDPASLGEVLAGSSWRTDFVPRIELSAEGIKRGRAHTPSGGGLVASSEGGPRLYARQIFPGMLCYRLDGGTITPPSGWSEVDCEVKFLTPVSTLLSSMPSPGASPETLGGNVAVSFGLTKRQAPATGEPAVALPEQRVVGRLSIGVPRKQRPDSIDNRWYYPVEREWYSDSGSVRWSASGLVLNPLSPQAASSGDELQSLTFSRYMRDDYGRPIHTILDAEPTASSFGALRAHPQIGEGDFYSVHLNDTMTEWPRIASTPALNYVTSFRYNGMGGALSDMFMASGRRWASRAIVISLEDRVIPPDINLSSLGDPLVWNQDGFEPSNPQTGYDSLDPHEAPNGRSREFVFNDLQPTGGTGSGGAPILGTTSLCEIREFGHRYATGPTPIIRRVYFARMVNGVAVPTTFSSAELDQFTDERNQHLFRFVTEAQVRSGIDANGRIARADLLEADASGAMLAVGSKEVNDLVDVLREREIDGTITRTTRNLLGQPMRRYVGTLDGSWYGTGLDPDNMVLAERFAYGSSPNDAWLPVSVWKYRTHPSWADTDRYTAPAVDLEGMESRTAYDWRMRPVRVDSYGALGAMESPGERLTTTLTYLDHLDRPYLTATFGSGTLPALGDLDPGASGHSSSFSDTGVRVSAAALIGLSLRPTSVEEVFYSPDGNVAQRWRYDMERSTSGTPMAHVEHTYTGRGGQEVYAQRPGQPVEITVLDGLGRAVSRRNLTLRDGAWGYELSRTDYELDVDGNVVDTRRYDRVSYNDTLSGDGVLSAEGANANAVRTRSVSWHDAKKRVVASAELGTEDEGRRYIASPLAYARSSDAPTFGLGDGVISGGGDLHVREAQSRALVSVNLYDLMTGRLTRTRNSDGTVTAMEYDRAGRLAAKVENSSGNVHQRRRTSYGYQWGRLVEMRAHRHSDATGNPVSATEQVTRVTYGAHVLSFSDADTTPTYTPASFHGGLVGRMSLPNPASGLGSTSGDIVLHYTIDGKIAERIDARGAVLRYYYDALDRLRGVEVGYLENPNDEFSFSPGYPESMNPVEGVPADRVGYVEYRYNELGQMSDVLAYAGRYRYYEGDVIITHTRFKYDASGNLLADVQSLGEVMLDQATEDATPRTSYSWDYQPTGATVSPLGHHRLSTIVYPVHEPGQTPRQINFAYGVVNTTGPPSVDHLFSRLTHVTHQNMQPATDLARFQYTGSGRRSSVILGRNSGIITADLHLGTEVGLAGLDMFGRVIDLHYTSTLTDPAARTLFRGEYAYDKAGNRLGAKITQAPVTGAFHANRRSQLNSYDELNRLIGTTVGSVTITDPHAAALDTSQATVRQDQWQLDLLGNWTHNAVTPGILGRQSSGNLDGFGSVTAGYALGADGTGASLVPWQDAGGADGDADAASLGFGVNARNEITFAQAGGGSGSQTAYVYDAAGNLIFDGERVYRYDAWNRVVQISTGHMGTVYQTGGGGTQNPPQVPVADSLLKHYTYDGLGRLVRTQSPWPDPATAAGEVRSERFYYDGVRRVQEVLLDPLLNLTNALASANATLQTLAQQANTAGGVPLDGESTPATLEQGQTSNLGGGTTINSGPVLWREYVWGPGDGPGGVDELLVQFDQNSGAWWALVDASGDVVALCDSVASETTPGAARVAAQWTYDAYGNITSADHLHPHAMLHCGHKGLFAERLDVGVAEVEAPGFAGAESPRLVPFGRVVYHNRNRMYSPGIGRFLQADPNATGMALETVPLHHGDSPIAIVTVFDLLHRYGDGPSLYQYLRSEPYAGSDPMGLTMWGLPTPLDLAAAAVMAPVRGLRGGLESMIAVYADNQEADVDWATDWSQPDDWHSRGDNSWVKDAWDDGVKGGIDEWVDNELMGLVDPFGIREMPGIVMARGGGKTVKAVWKSTARGLNRIGKVAHHIISFYKETAREFARLKQKHSFEFNLWDLKNMLPLDKAKHIGRHRKVYHQRVFDRLQTALNGKQGQEAQKAFHNALQSLARDIAAHPDKWFGP
jgi:YD repeat-containing protein